MSAIDTQSDVVRWFDDLIAAGAPRGDAARDLSWALMDRLDHPQRFAPAVHVVGTAGKGTFGAMLTARLVASGLYVASHQSPHVYDVRERFMLDGALVDWDIVVQAARVVARGCDDVARAHGRPPSFFAATAALSWELGRRTECDLFVTEAGIGGRADATAVLDRADTLTVIMSIGLDHSDVLGASVEQIAEEKAAVMRGRSDAVMAPQLDPRVASVIRACAATYGCTLHAVEAPADDWVAVARATVDGAAAILGNRRGVDIAALSDGFVVPGRGEVVERGDLRLVFDGAHNPMKLRSLRRSLRADPPTVLIVAVGAAKDLVGCAVEIAAFSKPVVVVEFGTRSGAGPRSWPTAELASAVGTAGGEAEIAADHDAAVALALRRTHAGDSVLITGSFLHLADIRRAFCV